MVWIEETRMMCSRDLQDHLTGSPLAKERRRTIPAKGKRGLEGVRRRRGLKCPLLQLNIIIDDAFCGMSKGSAKR